MPDAAARAAATAAAVLAAASRPHVIAIVGPTGVGKSAVAEEVAVRLDGEIITADSMQVYRGMDIGTAKVRREDRRVPHHCINQVDPGTPYSAALYQQAARQRIEETAARGRIPVLVGGTGLYVRAALDDMRFPAGNPASHTRTALHEELERLGPEALYDLLVERDPDAAALIHRNNTRRIIRALEMLQDGGVSYADTKERFADRNPFYPSTFIGLTMERDALYARIDARVDAMMEAGLLAEVEALLAAGYRDALTAAQAIGYKELVPVLEEGADLNAAVAAIKQASRRYAKRQTSWFNADPRVRWVDVTELSPAVAAEAARSLVESFARDARAGG
jgi:tRNA dimethylallyltransferase